VPRIERELHDASGVDAINDKNFEEREEREWARMQEVREAIENGWWSPRGPDTLQPPTPKEMQHYDPNVHVPMRERKTSLSD